MWTRVEVKAKGKIGFKRNYWPCVLVALVLSLLVDSAASVNVNANGSEGESFLQSISWSFLITASIILVLLAIFVFNVLEVGCRRFFLLNQLQTADMAEMAYGFKHNYQKNVLAQFMVNMIVAVGLLLFIIPGIVFSYQYRMVPYLLSEKPELTPKETLDASKAMMEGNKWDAFIYDLSFIGWIILGVCTFGILNLFYVNPYRYASDAELYLTIRANQINQSSNQPNGIN
jgi:uncharacterized membrane protein